MPSFPRHRQRHALPALFAVALLASLLACSALAPCAAWAQTGAAADARRPAEVAQVLFGIISYVRWPVARQEVRVCMVGAPRYGAAIVDTPASSLGQRIRVKIPAVASAASECDVIYLGSLPEGEREHLLAQIIGKPILSVAEPGTSCTVGTMFCLRLNEAQIGFDVNLDAIARSGLRVHPNALQIARRKGPPP
ncbi:MULTISPECIES: YfiR family protein [unclassified Janthinobacterium]|uniref:YfiR family protein n=1 Tax=unclassified Janthinobacterium TaxID=2610881 RepID=UPI001F35EF9D|nr:MULTISPECIES: YfiR family protein [unclassified Janthinobacterium]MDZ5636011.1 YfiR family protein [Janthinobacterium sp. GMG1]